VPTAKIALPTMKEERWVIIGQDDKLKFRSDLMASPFC